MLVTLAVSGPGSALAQMPDLPENTPGVSQQPPVPLDGVAQPEPGPDTPAVAQPDAGNELPNTGLDAFALLLAGAWATFLGVALRLRTADVVQL